MKSCDLYRYPRLILIILLVLAAIAFWPLRNIHLDFDIENLFPLNDPALERFRAFKSEFGPDDHIVIVGLSAPDIFTPSVLSQIATLTKRFETLPQLAKVTSLTNVSIIRGRDDALDVSTPFEIIPDDPTVLDSLRGEILSDRLLRHNLISPGGDFTVIVLEMARAWQNNQGRKLLMEHLLTIERESGLKLAFGGVPLVRWSYVVYMLNDVRWFYPTAVGLSLLILLVFFRRWQLIVLPFITIIIGALFTMAVMPLLNWEINIITYITPILITIMGTAYSLYFLTRFRIENLAATDYRQSVYLAVRHTRLPTFLASFTTAVAFLALLTSNLTSIRRFGLIVALGALLTYGIVFLFQPAILMVFPVRLTGRSDELHEHRGWDRLSQIIFRASLHGKYLILLLVGLVVAISGVGISRLSSDRRMFDDVEEGVRVYDDNMQLERQLGGILPLEIWLRSTAPDTFKTPAMLAKIERLGLFLKQFPEIGSVRSPADYFIALNLAMHDNDPAFAALPATRELAAQYLLLYSFEVDDPMEGLVSYDYTSARISARITDCGSARLETILAALNEFIRHEQSPDLSITATGTVVVNNTTHRYLVKNLMSSFSIAFIVIFATMLIMFRSFRLALIAIIPNVLPLVFVAGFMGWTSIRLKPSTAIIFTIALGISVDDTLHFLARLRAVFASCSDTVTCVRETLFQTTRAMVSTTLILVAGFSILYFSNFTATRYFGSLSSLAFTGALLGALFLLPSLLLIFYKHPADDQQR